MTRIIEELTTYTYGTAAVSTSAVTLKELEELKVSVGFTADDERSLRRAGEVLEGQTREIVAHWRSGIIASIPHLARHSRTPAGEPIPKYLAQSNLRFEQWILDTLSASLRPGLAELSAGDRSQAHESEEKPDRWSSVHPVCSLSRHHCLYHGAERHHQAIPRRYRCHGPRSRRDASCVVPFPSTANRAMVPPLHGSRENKK